MNSIKTIDPIHPDKIKDYIGKNVFVANSYYGKICKIIGVLNDGACVYEDWDYTPRSELNTMSVRIYLIDKILTAIAEN